MKQIKIILTAGVMLFIIGQKTNAQITNSDKQSLKYMYEEEKLAHDVYSVFSEKYNLPIFKNISKSETYHMSLILDLIEKNNINIIKKGKGIFENKELQKLYDKLIDMGNQNLVQALISGATVEDADIFDLNKYISTVSNQEIKSVYLKLLCGSENHMRAFTGHLKIQKTTYTPQYISQESYKSIIIAKHKKCF